MNATPYLLEGYTAEQERLDEYYPSEFEINRERFWAEYQDMEDEGRKADDMEKYFRAEDLGVTVADILNADQEEQSHYHYKQMVARIAAIVRDEDADEIPF